MSSSFIPFSVRRISFVAALLFSLVSISNSADAQRVRNVARQGKTTAKAKLPSKAKKFTPKHVSTTLKTAIQGKTLMTVTKWNAGSYGKVMKNSVEVMFLPHASEYGHLLVRVGNRLYDMPNPSGARNQKFEQAMRWVHSAGYGFVYARTESQIRTIQREFEAMANAGHSFSIAGTGPTSFSCAGFVTKVLKEHAPDLQVGLSAGAIGSARRILALGKYDGVTLYGSAAADTANHNFEFLKLQ